MHEIFWGLTRYAGITYLTDSLAKKRHLVMNTCQFPVLDLLISLGSLSARLAVEGSGLVGSDKLCDPEEGMKAVYRQ